MDSTERSASSGAKALEAVRSIVPGEVEPIKSGLPASNDGDLNATDLTSIDSAFGITEAQWQQADSEYDRMKNSGAYDERRIEAAYRNDPLGRALEDRFP